MFDSSGNLPGEMNRGSTKSRKDKFAHVPRIPTVSSTEWYGRLVRQRSESPIARFFGFAAPPTHRGTLDVPEYVLQHSAVWVMAA